MAMSRPWHHLPPELLHLIFQKAGDIATYVRLRSVCSSWRSALPPSLLPPQFPWLLLPYDPDDGSLSLSLFSLQTRETYRLDLPETRGKAICGSSYGWLALIDVFSNLSLFHPITRSEIPLPPPTGFPLFDHPRRVMTAGGRPDHGKSVGVERIEKGYPWKVFLSSSPTDPNRRECVVAVALSKSEVFAFCYLGEEVWSILDSELGSPVMSIVCHEGKFYVGDSYGDMTILDAHPWASKAKPVPCLYENFILTGFYLLTVPGLEEDDDGVKKSDAVVMVLVQTFYDAEDKRCDWVKMLQLRKGELQWEEVSSIGGCSMFLAGNHSSAVHGHGWGVSGCERDCVYFNQSEELELEAGRNLYYIDVFRPKDQRFEQYSCPWENNDKMLLQATWVTPTLY